MVFQVKIPLYICMAWRRVSPPLSLLTCKKMFDSPRNVSLTGIPAPPSRHVESQYRCCFPQMWWPRQQLGGLPSPSSSDSLGKAQGLEQGWGHRPSKPQMDRMSVGPGKAGGPEPSSCCSPFPPPRLHYTLQRGKLRLGSMCHGHEVGRRWSWDSNLV